MKSKNNSKGKPFTNKKSGSKSGSQDINPTKLKAKVLQIISKPKHFGYSSRTVLRNLNWENKHAKMLVQDVIEELLEEGLIYLTEENRYKASGAPDAVMHTGTIDHVNQRFAFATLEGIEKDIKIDTRDLHSAIDGDTVKVAIYEDDEENGQKNATPVLTGAVIEVIKRKRHEIVGVVQLNKTFAFVLPDSKKIYFDIYVPIDKIAGAQNGDKVMVKITEWPMVGRNANGIVTKVLGKAGEHKAEMHAIMAEFDLPFNFPKNVEESAKRVSSEIPDKEIAKRRDFRKITTFTIDPDNAKDFDDALSFQKLKNGNYEIGVHIADVTYYVKPNTLLEKEAYERATSVYLVDRVVPMLPERLSNGLCSLVPNEDRLTFAAVFEIKPDGHITNEWFGRTIIHSDRRFSYEEAQERIETKKGDFAKEINVLNDLAKKICEMRFQAGAISFETSEVKFKLDENGVPLALVQKVRKDSHKLIEEFMLLANKRVAHFVYEQQKGEAKNTMIYRVHEPPNPEKIATFATFVKRFGHKIETGKKMSDSFNTMSKDLEGKPEQSILQSLAVRTMSKAKYTTEPKGHFGLAFEHYSHFTSPIRRYPDMMAHRLLQHYLTKGKSVSKEEYEVKCKHSSDREKRAADAERASIKYKQVEFMQNVSKAQNNKVFDGIITGVTEFGIYVEITETKCEGLVRMSDLGDDFYTLDAPNYRVIGQNSKKIYSFGQAVQVYIKDTNLSKRTIDLELMPDKPSKSDKQPKGETKKPFKKGKF